MLTGKSLRMEEDGELSEANNIDFSSTVGMLPFCNFHENAFATFSAQDVHVYSSKSKLRNAPAFWRAFSGWCAISLSASATDSKSSGRKNGSLLEPRTSTG